MFVYNQPFEIRIKWSTQSINKTQSILLIFHRKNQYSTQVMYKIHMNISIHLHDCKNI